jgi:DNA-binding transcriptional MocR family regulator
MLKRLLNEIYRSEVFSKADFSKKLNLSEEMIDSAMEELVRMGYIIEEMGSPICESKCKSCAFSKCTTLPIKMFTISDKGEKLLEKN